MPKKYSSIGLFFLGLIGLIAVRGFEAFLFYDPLQEYFRGNFSQHDLPPIEEVPFIGNLLLRYFCNMVFSLLILYALFRDYNLLKFAALIYLVFFVLLMLSMVVLLYFIVPINDLALFYVRRFLVQPILVLLFIPAFYFQRKTTA